MRKSRPIFWAAMIWVILLMSAGCTVEIPQEAQPKMVRALWDPSTSTLPSPTNLVLDDELGQLQLPVDASMPPAERDFRQYLNLLDGYPLPTTLTILLSGPIQEHSLPGTLAIVEVSTGNTIDAQVSYDAPTMSIKAYAPDGFAPGRTYVFGLWGYDGGVKGAQGEPVVADAAFYMVRRPYPLSEHATAMPGETRAERQETAETLELVQDAYEPLFRAMEHRGIKREHVATASSFTTTNRPAIWFDSTSSQIPMPNNLLIDAETGLVDLPIADDVDAERRAMLEGLATYDGFSMSGAITVKTTHQIGDGAHLDADAIRLYAREKDGSWKEVIDVQRGRLDDRETLWIRPRMTLDSSTEHAYVVSRSLSDHRGLGHEAQPLGAMLRLP
ncbi:MAG: hypothetical protein ACNA8W_25880, partial [Bradymonadaceae bacterium]